MNEQKIEKPCWWVFYHKWTQWILVTETRAGGDFVQEKTCEKCGLLKRRHIWVD